jgi:alkylated DNA nucleotide flippase Atl1
MAKKKTWREKLAESKNLPKVEVLTGDAAKRWGGETLAIPAPKDVDAIMKRVPRGKVITVADIREKIAKKYEADVGCPLTCGIFAWIAANAAEEDAAEGKDEITPWWRTLKSGGELNPKFPGGIDRQRALLESEGHVVVARGKRFFVADPAAKPAAKAAKKKRATS